MSLRSHIITGVFAGMSVGLLVSGYQANAAVAPALKTQIVEQATNSGLINCPKGWIVVGGGYRMPNDSITSTSSTEHKAIASYPVSTTAWRTDWVVRTGTYNSTTKVWTYTSRQGGTSANTYAVCAKVQ